MLDAIMSQITHYTALFAAYSKENPIVAGAFSLWGLGVLSYFSRNIPQRIWGIVRKQSTTKLTLFSTSDAFHNFLHWYNAKGYDKHLRSFKISSGKWGDSSDATKSIGYGTHFFMHRWRPGSISLVKDDSARAQIERDSIEISLLGRSGKVFDEIFDEIRRSETTTNDFLLYKYTGDYWARSTTQKKRDIDTIFLQRGVKEKIVRFIDSFRDHEQWYLEKGLPYHIGMILYGPPGCGKTSLVKALASHYNVDLYVFPVSQFAYIDRALFDLPDHSMVLIEDIDAERAVSARNKNSKRATKKAPVMEGSDKPEAEEQEPGILLDFSLTNLSDVLNSIDGIISSHGRVLIATTNHIEKLDEALTRNGRFDLKIELGFVDEFVLKNMMQSFYPDFKIPRGYVLREGVSAADVQSKILENLDNPLQVLYCLGKEEKR